MLRDPFSVLVVIENCSHQFLLLQRTDDANFWQSVTGGIEANETPIACAYREVYEETGINCEKLGLTIKDLNVTNRYPIRPQWQHRYKQGATINTEYVFHLQVPTGQAIVLDSAEHLSFKWLGFFDAYQQLGSNSNKQALKIINLKTG